MYVKAGVALNKSTPADVLEAMLEANEDDERIIICLLSNPNLPERCVLHETAKLLRQMEERDTSAFLIPWIKLRFLSKLPTPTLVALSQSSNVSVRREMAKNPLLPADCLVMLSRDSHTSVVDSLASNPTVQMAVDRLSCEAEKGRRPGLTRMVIMNMLDGVVVLLFLSMVLLLLMRFLLWLLFGMLSGGCFR
jgi:hypothetical protein